MKVARLEDLSDQDKIKILEQVIEDIYSVITIPSQWGRISRASSRVEMTDALFQLIVESLSNIEETKD